MNICLVRQFIIGIFIGAYISKHSFKKSEIWNILVFYTINIKSECAVLNAVCIYIVVNYFDTVYFFFIIVKRNNVF